MHKRRRPSPNSQASKELLQSEAAPRCQAPSNSHRDPRPNNQASIGNQAPEWRAERRQATVAARFPLRLLQIPRQKKLPEQTIRLLRAACGRSEQFSWMSFSVHPSLSHREWSAVGCADGAASFRPVGYLRGLVHVPYELKKSEDVRDRRVVLRLSKVPKKLG